MEAFLGGAVRRAVDSFRDAATTGETSSEDFKGTERFAVQQRLGSGAFGTVFKALDKRTNSAVALKLLTRTGADSLYGFKREFRALADIIHPNLVTLYELISEGDWWFFTMELVDEISFTDVVRRRTEAQSVPAATLTAVQPGAARESRR